MTTANIEDDRTYTFEREKFLLDNVIITIFDTTKQKRLIVDGVHRASALTIVSKKGLSIPDVKVVECYGDRIDVLFPCDSRQL